MDILIKVLHGIKTKSKMRETSIFNLPKEIFLHLVNEGQIETPIIRNIDALKTSDDFLDALTVRMVSIKSFIRRVATLFNCHVECIAGEHRLDLQLHRPHLDSE